MTPISAIALVAQSEAGAASGLFNMMRDLGGAIGTAAVEAFFTKREQYHSAIITAIITPQVPAFDLGCKSSEYPDARGDLTPATYPFAAQDKEK